MEHVQARELQAIATKVHSKFFISVLKKSSEWAQRMAALPRPLHDLPCSVLCTGFDLLWHTNTRESPVITIWRPICPAGYKPLGDVVERGFDHPDPVQVLPSATRLGPSPRAAALGGHSLSLLQQRSCPDERIRWLFAYIASWLACPPITQCTKAGMNCHWKSLSSTLLCISLNCVMHVTPTCR